MEVIHTDFKSGLEALIKCKSIRAIFLGVRIGDPTAVKLSLYLEGHATVFLLPFVIHLWPLFEPVITITLAFSFF